jgi:LemA protein
VSTVQGFADQELEVFTEVTKARASATQTTVDIDDATSLAEFQEAQGELGGALSRLLVTVEAYPELKSNVNFLDLQKQLEGTENRIAVARMDYNTIANTYNIAIRRVPIVFVASYLGFDSKALFQAEAGADVAPDVTFE